MFRFAHAVSFALFVTLSSMTVLAQSDNPISPRRKFDHKLEITTKYDQSSDTTGVRLLLKHPNTLARLAAGGASAGPTFAEDVGISASFTHPGKQLSRAVEEASIWITYTGGPRTAFTNEIVAKVDGREMVLSSQIDAQPLPDRRKGTRIGAVKLSVTRVGLAQLANGSKVVLLLPSGERITLTREQLNALADFTSRMSP